jgi:hypothetical protein
MRLILLITLAFTSSQVFGQLIRWNTTAIDKQEYNQCIVAQPSFNKPPADDTLVTDDLKFKILGTLKGLSLFTFMKSIPDNKIYMANNETGWVDELLGFPVFSPSLKTFVSFGDGSGQQLIRVYEIRSKKVNTKFDVPFFKTATEISCVTDSSFCVKDISENYWKYSFHNVR